MKIETEFREDLNAKSKSFYAKGENVAVTWELINDLYLTSGGKNARLCLHQGSDDGFHQMLIVEYRGHSFAPHRHPTKSEGYHLIFGEMELVLYADDGKEEERFNISQARPIARVGPNTVHGLEIVTPFAIYLESKPGPFVRDNDKVIPLWAQR